MKSSKISCTYDIFRSSPFNREQELYIEQFKEREKAYVRLIEALYLENAELKTVIKKGGKKISSSSESLNFKFPSYPMSDESIETSFARQLN